MVKQLDRDLELESQQAEAAGQQLAVQELRPSDVDLQLRDQARLQRIALNIEGQGFCLARLCEAKEYG